MAFLFLILHPEKKTKKLLLLVLLVPILGGQGERVFSPAYVYNQINGGQDRGSYFHDALNLIINKGASPWKYMPYREDDYLTQPTPMAHQVAQKFRAKSSSYFVVLPAKF